MCEILEVKINIMISFISKALDAIKCVIYLYTNHNQSAPTKTILQTYTPTTTIAQGWITLIDNMSQLWRGFINPQHQEWYWEIDFVSKDVWIQSMPFYGG